MRLSTESLARVSSRHPWRVIASWIVLLVVGGFVAARLLSGVLTTDVDFTNDPESKRAREAIEERLRGPEKFTEFVIVSSGSSTVDDPEFQAYVGELAGQVLALGPEVVEPPPPGDVEGMPPTAETLFQDPRLVSTDRGSLLIPVTLAGSFDEATDNQKKVLAVIEENPNPGFEVLIAGQATINNDFMEVSEEDLRRGESIGVIAALFVLLIVFGALAAALLPILLGIAAITVAIGVTALVGQAFDFSFFVVNMIVMMGLAVGIDYSLFIVSRYREERRHGLDKHKAIAVAGGTASRAVFFSGMTVVLALCGMLIIPTTIFTSLAAGAIFVVLLSVLASLTLLPAVLSLVGDRVNALAVPILGRRLRESGPQRGGFWDRLARGVMRRPVSSLVASAGLLIVVALPVFLLETGFAGVTTLPDDTMSRRAFGVLSEKFAGGIAVPLEVVVDADIASPRVQAGIQQLEVGLAGDGRFGPAELEVNGGGDLAVVSAPFIGDPSSADSVASIDYVRKDVVPRAFPQETVDEVLVGGQTAFTKDFFDLTDEYTPWVFAFVLGLSLLLLTVVFRSVVVPVKAILLNLLSVGAAYGLMIVMTQEGVGPGWVKDIADVLGFQQVEKIEAWIPLFLFSVLFGLSMDYHVFLLSRIRERFDQTGDNTGSVAHGVRTTAGIITGAALIMVAVFSGFASGDLVGFQQVGFGLAVAVLIDATIIRSVLVPSSMRLLGNLNWYLPRWLEWLPRIRVEAEAAPAGPIVAGGADDEPSGASS